MDTRQISREEWRAARQALVDQLTQLRDQFSRAVSSERESVAPAMGFAQSRAILR
jgi:hypothetical protein